jgi:hypothetical protein
VKRQCPLNCLIKQLSEKGSGVLLNIAVKVGLRTHGVRV